MLFYVVFLFLFSFNCSGMVYNQASAIKKRHPGLQQIRNSIASMLKNARSIKAIEAGHIKQIIGHHKYYKHRRAMAREALFNDAGFTKATYTEAELTDVAFKEAQSQQALEHLQLLAQKVANKSLTHASPIKCIRYAFDNTLLLTASYDGVVKIWDITGDLLGTLTNPTPGFINAEFSKYAQTVLITFSTHAVLYNLNNNTSITIEHDQKSIVRFTNDGSYILSSPNQTSIEFLCAITGKPMYKVVDTEPFDMALEALYSGYVVTVSTNNTLKLWQLSPPMEQAKINRCHLMEKDSEYKEAMADMQRKSTIATSMKKPTNGGDLNSSPWEKEDNTGCFLAIAPADLAYSLELPKDPVDILFTQNDEIIAIIYHDSMSVIDTKTHKEILKIGQKPQAYASIAQKLFITAASRDEAGNIITGIYDLLSNICIKSFDGAPIIKFSKTGRYFVAISPGILEILDLATKSINDFTLDNETTGLYDDNIEFINNDNALLLRKQRNILNLLTNQPLAYPISDIYSFSSNNQQLAYVDIKDKNCCHVVLLLNLPNLIKSLTPAQVTIINQIAHKQKTYKEFFDEHEARKKKMINDFFDGENQLQEVGTPFGKLPQEVKFLLELA